MVVIGMRVGHLAPTVGVKRTPMRIPIPVQPSWAVAESGGERGMSHTDLRDNSSRENV